MTDITKFPTANLGFSTTASSQKVPASDYNIERQPEVAIWPSKPEIVIPLELQQIASKFQRQVPDFRPWSARIKCRQVIATMIDNQKWQCGPQNRKYLYLWMGCGEGVSPFQLTRGSGGASWAPPAGSEAEPQSKTYFSIFKGHRAALAEGSRPPAKVFGHHWGGRPHPVSGLYPATPPSPGKSNTGSDLSRNFKNSSAKTFV